MATDDTQAKHSGLKPWKPGQSGNPAGRPKGSRVKLGEKFLSDLMADWEDHGAQAIKDMREDKPGDYVKVVAATLPKELNVKVSELDELTDEQIARQLAAVTRQLAEAGFDIGAGISAPSAPEQIN
jgi:ribulose bisphosphate carboxylase small subunit